MKAPTHITVVRWNASMLGLLGRWMLAVVFVSALLFSVFPLQPGNPLLGEAERAAAQERLLWLCRATAAVSALVLWYALGRRETTIDFGRRVVTVSRVFPLLRYDTRRIAFDEIDEVRVRRGVRHSDTVDYQTRKVDLVVAGRELRLAFEVDPRQDWPEALERELVPVPPCRGRSDPL